MYCPLCQSENKNEFCTILGKAYRHCQVCQLIFMDKAFYLDSSAEKARYESHNNDLKDERYRQYLLSTVACVREKLKAGMRVLDWGSGPTDAMSALLREDGLLADAYDPFFYPMDFGPQDKYDLVIMSECLEHFFHPMDEWKKIRARLKTGGQVVVRTERHQGAEMFPNWYYHKDPTHVIFFHEQTFQFVANTLNWTVQFPTKNLALFSTNQAPA